MISKLHLDTYALQSMNGTTKATEKASYYHRVLDCLGRIHDLLEDLDDRVNRIEEKIRD